MISRQYFKYLLKSKKYLLLIIALITLIAILLMRTASTCGFLFGFSIALAYILPFDNFSFLHNKKAVDTYFALPISRKQSLNTGILFCWLSAGLPILVGLFACAILELQLSINLIVFAFIIFVFILVLVIFNTLTYSIGNNTVDGVILTIAYTLLSGAVYLSYCNFLECFVAGGTDFVSNFYIKLSPVFLGITIYVDSIVSNFKNINLSINEWINFAYLIGYGVVGYIVLRTTFQNRKVERAGMTSSGFFAYPLIINIYLILSIFSLATCFNFTYDTIGNFIKEYIVLYLVIFILYVAAHFIYKRKFFFNFKMPIIFVLALVLSFGFAYSARQTKGFGLAYQYEKSGEHTRFEYNYWPTSEEGNELTKWIQSNGFEKVDYHSINIVAGRDNTYSEGYALLPETLAFMEEVRQNGIDVFYTTGSYGNSSIYIYNDYNKKTSKNYYYHCDYQLKEEDIQMLLKDPNVEIWVYVNDHDYLLDKDGHFMIQEYRYYEKDMVVEEY